MKDAASLASQSAASETSSGVPIRPVIDDIDGVELDEYETVRWSLDGRQYEFDTSPDNAEKFRDHVASYLAVSRPVAAQPRRRAVAAPGRSTKQIRQWAQENGFDVSPRGRIPADVEAAYNAAH